MNMKKLAALLLIPALLAAPALPALADVPYRDVPPEAWYAGAVDHCSERGLMNGVGKGLFEPEAPVSRGMAVTVLYRMAGSPTPGTAESFRDIASDAWYGEAVRWAVDAALTSGVGNGLFAPENPVTRQDLAVFLWRNAGRPAAATAGEPFTDAAEIDGYAAEAVAWARSASLLDGMGDGSFRPRAGATRAQLATVLMRLDQRRVSVSEMDVQCAPSGIALAPDGTLLVTDTYYKCVWRMEEGRCAVYAGGDSVRDPSGEPVGGYRDASLAESLFREPWAIAPFKGGWAVSDAKNGVVRLITSDGVQTLNAGEAGGGGARITEFHRPTGLAVDEAGNLYVADTGSGEIVRITPAGGLSIFAAGLNEPTGLCWQGDSLYVAETGANRVLALRGGSLQVVAGSGEAGYADGEALSAQFNAPVAVAVDGDGTVYVSDLVNSALRRVREGRVDTLLRAEPGAMLDWPVSPRGLLLCDGALYLCDNFTNKLLRLQLR